jgi:hypothetical protein
MNREEMKLRIKELENQLSSQSSKTPSDNNVFVVIHSFIAIIIKNAQYVLQALRRLLLPCRRLNSYINLSNMNGFNILTIVLTILFTIPSCNIIEDIISDTKSTDNKTKEWEITYEIIDKKIDLKSIINKKIKFKNNKWERPKLSERTVYFFAFREFLLLIVMKH